MVMRTAFQLSLVPQETGHKNLKRARMKGSTCDFLESLPESRGDNRNGIFRPNETGKQRIRPFFPEFRGRPRVYDLLESARSQPRQYNVGPSVSRADAFGASVQRVSLPAVPSSSSN